MKLFVYGTLKMGGINYDWYLYDSKFLGQHKMEGFILADIGHGFPYMLKSNNSKDVVYGELYEVSEDRILKIDLLEGVPSMYVRKTKNNISYYESTMDLNIIIETQPRFKTLNYWEIDDSRVLFNVFIDDRKYTDDVEKLIFHMRFFDLDRAKTNKQYMELVKKRSHLKDLPIDSCGLFFRYCIINNILEEFEKPYLSEKEINPQFLL